MENITTTIISAVGIVTYFAVAITFANLVLRRQQDVINKRKIRFQRAIIEGFKTNVIQNISDVINVYRGVYAQQSEELSNRFGISKMLRQLIVEMLTNRKNLSDSPITEEQIHLWSTKLSALINENELVSPYADLPSAERNALIDISLYLESDDKVAVKRKTLELAGMIQARNDDMITIRATNRWTLPLSIVGVILTLVFGVMAFIK